MLTNYTVIRNITYLHTAYAKHKHANNSEKAENGVKYP